MDSIAKGAFPWRVDSIGARTVLSRSIKHAVASESCAGRAGRTDIDLHGVQIVGPPRAFKLLSIPCIEFRVRLIVFAAAKQPPEVFVLEDNGIDRRHARKKLTPKPPDFGRLERLPKG
jgi:hypothetical protein